MCTGINEVKINDANFVNVSSTFKIATNFPMSSYMCRLILTIRLDVIVVIAVKRSKCNSFDIAMTLLW
jgi:hypothetical protein